jgi:Terminase large subunit, T4likevirus-type, N-terminal
MGFRRSNKAGRVDPVPGQPIVEAGAILSIIDVCQDPDLFGPWFKGPSWVAWFVFLKTMFALPLDAAELALFKQCTGRSAPSLLGYLEVTLVIGRRGGKSLILALIAAYLGAFFNWAPYLTAGERASVVIIATDRRQATVIFKYLRAFLGVAMIKGMIERETADTIDLNNGVTIEIQTASHRGIRGRTICAALCDELAFWRTSDDNSANPDTEILAALRPAMATIPKAMLLKASSPCRRHLGKSRFGPFRNVTRLGGSLAVLSFAWG